MIVLVFGVICVALVIMCILILGLLHSSAVTIRLYEGLAPPHRGSEPAQIPGPPHGRGRPGARQGVVVSP